MYFLRFKKKNKKLPCLRKYEKEIYSDRRRNLSYVFIYDIKLLYF